MYILIVLVITTTGSTMNHIKFNSSVACLEAMARVLEFERHGAVKVIKTQCVKE